jgi:hypothetical protein
LVYQGGKGQGLPLGLLAAGNLIDGIGFAATGRLYVLRGWR